MNGGRIFAQKSQPQTAGSLRASPNRFADKIPPAFLPEPSVRRFDFESIPAYGPQAPRPHALFAINAPHALWQRTTRDARVLQAKLEIGAFDDPLEREADRVADAVMRSPTAIATTTESATVPASAANAVQRKCALRREDENGDAAIHRKVQNAVGAGTVPAALPNVGHVLRSPGRPLDAPAREFMETRFARDFSHVRIYDDAQAHESAASVHARAYTVGQSIVFGDGQYHPESPEGRKLLAHELTHVVQQTGSAGKTHSDAVAHDLSSAPAGTAQPKLVATGDRAGFASVANTVIGVQFTVRVAADGEVTLAGSNVSGPLTADAQELVRVLRDVIGNAGTTTIRFIRGQTSTDAADARVFVGSFPQSKIDLDDVLALGIHTSGYNAGAALAHEISEELEKHVTGADFGPAHAIALNAEARAVGATRIADTARVINATTLEFTFSYRYPDGRILDQVMTVTNGNITNVVRTWRP
ncbi:DUF4157 domain-containing protein [Pendulispora albinea]|uniref:DUF4157 domain-containing protein n=1 Tax=Pendulispora albinea TaxID=2741071 RepID=A0ABZ2M3P2_9BACT